MEATIVGLAIGVFIIITLAKTARIVPQRQAFVIERLGKYHKILEAGFHILVPFLDKVAYKHSLKEIATDVAQQSCITKDNIQVVVDGVIYLQVINAKEASYGIDNFRYAATQLAQTTLRSVIGKIDLDKTFEEREKINQEVVEALDEAATSWGIKVLRYEIADIIVPETIRESMEKQMKAERERRAAVSISEGQRQAQINISEGERQSKINISEGEKQEVINHSEAHKQRQINEAEGKAREISLIAEATAEGVRTVAKAIQEEGGKDAVSMRIAEQYVEQFGNLAKENNTMIMPAELTNIGSAVAGLTNVLGFASQK